MNPNDKARELLLMYYGLIPMNTISFAKQCALIAVDLRLKGDFIFSSIEYGGEESLEYWIEVKKEIENL